MVEPYLQETGGYLKMVDTTMVLKDNGRYCTVVKYKSLGGTIHWSTTYTAQGRTYKNILLIFTRS